jgi:hypothetical protein
VKPRLFHRLALSLLGGLVASAISVPSQAFEFLDDFAKPWYCQRDPWEERIETERHDFTQSAITVGRRVVQVESGYTYFYNDSEGETESSHAFPEMLVRVGLSEDIEFRLRWSHVWQFIDEEPDRSGSEDLRYSLKLQMTREECRGLLPTSALELRGTAPTGSEEFTTEHVEVSLDYIYQWTLAEGITLVGSTGMGTNGFADFGLVAEVPPEDRFHVLSQSVALGFELSESNTMYAEWYGIFSDGLEDEFVISVFNFGIDHYVTNNFVLDWRAGVGLSDDADDFFTGVGGGWRF